jgi:hypothetical protein
MSDCYYDAQGCLICPEQDASPYVPAVIRQVPVLGWNAGANSITQLAGDLHCVFSMPLGTTAVVIGLKSTRQRQTLPDLIENGWYFQSLAGTDMAQVVERGQVKTALSERVLNDTFEIRRSGGNVSYLKNGNVVYRSAVPSDGTMVVNTCMYASGDAVPDNN